MDVTVRLGVMVGLELFLPHSRFIFISIILYSSGFNLDLFFFIVFFLLLVFILVFIIILSVVVTIFIFFVFLCLWWGLNRRWRTASVPCMNARRKAKKETMKRIL